VLGWAWRSSSGLGGVLGVEGDQLGATQASGEAEHEQGAVAPAGERGGGGGGEQAAQLGGDKGRLLLGRGAQGTADAAHRRAH
jgi:hypothetical protein